MGDGHVQPFQAVIPRIWGAAAGRSAEPRQPAGKACDAEGKPRRNSAISEQREYDTIEQEIETLELTLDEIKTQMAQAGSDYVALQRLTEEQQTLETKNRTKDGPVGGAGGDGPAHAVVGRQRWTSRRI